MGREQFYDEFGDDIVFTTMNPDVLKRLRKLGKVVLPKKKIKIPKDMQWNTKLMASRLIRGLERGDSVYDIAESLVSIIGSNEASTIRNARTMVTEAECGGREQSYHDLDEKGVVQKKVWIATPDDRTRPTHMDMDGEEQDIDAVFSNGCRYPGDADGPPEEVWQCRCSMRDHIVGFRRSDGSISYVNYKRGETMHDAQMEREKLRREAKK